jgi:hypothetical protein
VDQDRLHSTVIGVFRTRGILYASLTDLAQTFQLTPYENVEAAKMELKQGPYRIKVTGGRPVIIVTEQAQRQTVYQLPVNVLFAAGSFFVPLQSFLPFFSLVFNKTATFDPDANILRVGTESPASLFDIPTVHLEPKTNGMLIRIPSNKRIEDVRLVASRWMSMSPRGRESESRQSFTIKETGIIKDIVAISLTSVRLTFTCRKIAASSPARGGSRDILVSVRTPDAEEGKWPRLLLLPGTEARRSVDRTVTPGALPDLSEQKNDGIWMYRYRSGHGGHDRDDRVSASMKGHRLTIALKLERSSELRMSRRVYRSKASLCPSTAGDG